MSNKSKYSYTQNREVSWLRFNERVLKEAEKPGLPAFEKLNFIAIFVSNLTEFFMVRVGSLSDLTEIKKEYRDNKTGMTASEQIHAILEMLPPMLEKKDELYENVSKELKSKGIERLRYADLSPEQGDYIKKLFDEKIRPVLSPQIINVSHPFPFLENDRYYIALEGDEDGKKVFGIVPMRTDFPYYEILKGSNLQYILTEDIMLSHVDELFPDIKITDRALISVTRNFDWDESSDLGDEMDDYKSYMKSVLKRRKRQQAVRLESNKELTDFMKKMLAENLELSPKAFFVVKSPLHMKHVYSLIDDVPTAIKREMTYEPYTPYYPYSDVTSLMNLVEKKDFMLLYPFDDMSVFLNLIKEASKDPRVMSIKITIYRLAKNSKLVKYLCEAAENGVDVTAFMELKARFDEENNINYSDILYESGANIIYGFPDYKVHSKLCLITYQDKGKVKTITQVGTGNYNESTSKLYTDWSLFTASEDIGLDASDFFRNLSTGKLEGHYKLLLQSPSTLKVELLSLIDEEIKKGEQGEIFAKMNSFTDKDFIEKIREASKAGVKIRLLIRGISCILPGIEGETENLQIRSIVGRYLEHARVFRFGNGTNEKIYISSADWMTRNTERRVEIAAPILDNDLKQTMDRYIDVEWSDNVNARRMKQNGEYEKIQGDVAMDSHEILMNSRRELEKVSIENMPLPVEEQRESIFEKIKKFFKK